MKYLGNKSRLSSFIEKTLDLKSKKGQTALDLFSGTCAVTKLFRRHGITTDAVDNLNFCYHVAVCHTSLDMGYTSSHLSGAEKARKRGFIYKNYAENCGITMFKDDIAEAIDGGNEFIEDLHENHKIGFKEYCYLKTALIEAADFRSNIMGSYESYYKNGWRKQCEKTWSLKDLDLPSGSNGAAHREDVIDFLKNAQNKQYDFVYADPPYNSRQYSTNFHALETISLNDNPKVFGKINRREDNVRSSFCYKKKAQEQFNSLFELASTVTDNFYMSYSNEGIVKVAELESLMLKHYQTVSVVLKPYRKFKTNSKIKNTDLKEIIFICNNRRKQ